MLRVRYDKACCSLRGSLYPICQADALVGDFQPNLDGDQVLLKLVNITALTANDSRRPDEIYGGDLEISVNILSKLMEYNAGRGNGSLNNQTDSQNFIRAASNLLEKANSESWILLDEVDPGNFYSMQNHL